ncbi:hypothetical protein [Aminobacter ciceronei]|jgi:hypothetical protein|uniref:Uncharacterized protein n=1 Tax=Aminobacter ciceronei TaxID=150723 RepID=A0ABR6CHZ4_9HYPH|nr:hypothetical protein [Aminobacter ciceronei]MBA8910761.1 hypothetical protein [Aminobacter ciceronei]MBA9024534.1 hypothetical protein [Aminobacter ciceronei]
MALAYSRLAEKYRAEIPRYHSHDRSPLASVLVDRNGLITGRHGVAVSSFAWGLPKALKGNLRELTALPCAKQAILGQLYEELHDTSAKALTYAAIKSAYLLLLDQIGLSEEFAEPPSFALRVFHRRDLGRPPSPLQIDSDFLSDLSAVRQLVRCGKVPAALSRYLRISSVEHDGSHCQGCTKVTEQAPDGQRPERNWAKSHPTLNFTSGDSLFAINATQFADKLHLIFDLVATCIMERARRMLAFEKAEHAFTAVQPGGAHAPKLYRLHPSLKGQEIVIASTSNQPIKDICEAIVAADRNESDWSYFRSISDHVYNPRLEQHTAAVNSAELKTKGLLAAVLGNAKNRSDFIRPFWRNPDTSFRTYLRFLDGRSIRRKSYSVIAQERPPLHKQAQDTWSELRGRLAISNPSLSGPGEFAMALEIHKAFVDVSGHYLLHNLSALMEIIESGSVRNDVEREQIADLWSSLFLIVPIVSTSLSSVDRLFRYVPSGSFGWSVIDEANRALPQTVAGLLGRTRKAIIFGNEGRRNDSVPSDSLAASVFEHFGISSGDCSKQLQSCWTFARDIIG